MERPIPTLCFLGTFSPEVALEYLTSEGVPEGSARELNRVTRGHPVALSLGRALYFVGGQVRGSAATRHQVLEHMAALFLEDADSGTIQVLEAACLVRTATAPLLAAMLPPSSRPMRHWIGCVRCHLSA